MAWPERESIIDHRVPPGHFPSGPYRGEPNNDTLRFAVRDYRQRCKDYRQRCKKMIEGSITATDHGAGSTATDHGAGTTATDH